jgi:3-hydroxypropionyl-CoA synthetase (ADP-forming)
MGELASSTRERIDAVIERAASEGRSALHEHEVYDILSAVGLAVPRFRFVRDPAEVDERLLAGFGHTVVAKVVSSDVHHKSRVGGVRKVATTDPLYVRFVLERMRGEVTTRVAAERPASDPVSRQGPRIDGFLVIEHVPHTEALGYEVLIGFREDPAFGPVLTVSKGGDDAEFFAAHYDPANLFLPPMSYEEALAFTRSLHIRYKFEQTGHLECLDLMARAIERVSSLASAYSPGAHPSRWVFSSFEVNPFAITRDARFVALDGLAEFRSAGAGDLPGKAPDLSNLDAFFRPKGVVVVGVSSDPAKYSLGRDIAELLHDMHRDDLHLVNLRGGAVRLGRKQYDMEPDMRELKHRVELAVYAAPAPAAPEFLRSLAGGSVRAVILIPGVPSATSYAEYAREIREATPPGVRVMGPNCMGVFHGPDGPVRGINTLFINRKRLEVGSSPRSNAVLLTQSGALAVTALDKLRNARVFRAVASFGNKVDVKASDLLAWFAADPKVDVVALYLEGLDPGEGRQMFDQARLMRKPLVAYKAGRTAAGARSAASHTAALSGSYEVFRSACAQAGTILAGTIEEYYDLVRTFALLAGRKPSGNRVAGVVNAGFESTMGGDELAGLAQARLSRDTVAELNEINRSGLVDTSSPFLDVTPMADDRLYARFVEAILKDEGVDCVFVAVVPHAVTLKTVPETCRDADSLGNLLLGLSRTYAKPMVVSVNAGRHYADFVSVLEEGGLPVYEDIRSAITSLDAFVAYHLRPPEGRANGNGASGLVEG